MVTATGEDTMTTRAGTGGATKKDKIAAELRRRILTGQLPRGERLRQDQLARELSTSITPVREAMRVLEAEGLLVSESHKGVRVAGLDLERTKGTYIVRRLVESYAMRRAALRFSRLDLAQARALIEQMQQALDAADPARYQELNERFHFHFYERCGVPSLCDEIRATWQSFPWDLSLESLDRSAASQAEHTAIVDAMAVGDPDLVAQATEQHIAHGFAALIERATGTRRPDPFPLEAD